MAELPSPEALFIRFTYEAGDEPAARTRFQRLVTDLVTAGRPGATEIAAPNGSDWGIDTYVGRLDDKAVVWQSKCFLKWDGESQRGQVRASFNDLMKKAAEKGFSVSSWTLCVPCILPPDEQRWLDGWMSRMKRAHHLEMDVWNGVELRRQLQLPDNQALRQLYFPPYAGDPDLEYPEVRILEDASILDDALFVKQLEAAGHLETDAAKGYYFAAEAMARDVILRGDKPEVAALNEIQLEAHGTWERAFNAAAETADADGRMSGLVANVTTSVESLPSPLGLPLRSSHKHGLMHRLVEAARAGWVVDWREHVKKHHSRGAVESLGQAGAFRIGGERDA